MHYNFAPRMDNLKPSAIREILKYSSDPEVIPFSAGNPSPNAFPAKEITKITQDILTNEPTKALQYGLSEGYSPLIQCVNNYIKNSLNINTQNNSTLIMSGAQQVIDLTAKAFCKPSDVIVCEKPTFLGALNSFKANDATIACVDMESDGVSLEKLESAFKEHKNIKFFYTIPNFQNPTGITMSFEKRKAVYELCKKYGVLILEDDPYGELRFSGKSIPSIKSLDTDGLVIYCGSFSKVLSPGLRVGFVCASEEITNKMIVLKQANDVHTSMLSQMIVHSFIQNYDFKKHLNSLRKIYKQKANLMLSSIDENFSKNVKWTVPDGGLFLWCELPRSINMLDFCKDAVKKHKVAVVPGNVFLPDDNISSSSFRMNYSTPSNEQIIKGIKTLGMLTKNL